MTITDNRPPILAPVPAGVPAEMRALRRWAPWRAEWDERKKKWTKIPHRAARPEYGLSNKNATGWVTFDQAMAAYLAHPDKFAGVGYLMTGPHGITGVDLDKCRDPATGKLDDWAAELIAKLDTYTEVSPSGTGLHAFTTDQVSEDWSNHDRGIEVYGGNEARFLCITGQRVPGTRGVLRAAPETAFADIEAGYRKTRTKAEVEDLHLPDLLPVELLPSLSELDLPPHAANFLAEGPDAGRDRSQQLFATSIALHQAGLAKDEVLSILEDNEHAMEVALDHRRQDYDKALRYLWKQHCQAGAVRGEQLKEERYGAFDALEAPEPPDDEENAVAASSDDPMGDFDVLPPDDSGVPAKVERKTKFPLVSVSKFLKRKPMQWIIRGILPKAAMVVIFGDSTAGKTFLALDLVLAITRGADWRGKRVTKGRGVYIVAEGADGFRNRMQAYCDAHDVDPDDLDLVLIPAAPQMMNKAEVVDLIKDLQTLGPLDFVVMDTYARVLVGGNENDATDTGVMIDHCARVHRHTGALVILIHHTPKDGNGMRGSGALKGAADAVIEVIRTKDYRAARIDKMKDGDDSGEFRFKLPVVEMGVNEDGDPITSCIVEHMEGDAPKSVQGRRFSPMQETVVSTLDSLLDLSETPVYPDELKRAVVSQIPRDPAKKKDNRHRDVGNAIDALVEAGDILMGDMSALSLAKNSG